MYTGNRKYLYARLALLILCFVMVPQKGNTAEIAAFRLTDTSGHLGLRYRYDGDVTEQSPSSVDSKKRSVFEEEVYLQTDSYVYHPNMLKINLGASILLSQESLQTALGKTEREDSLYNVNANLMFLEKKPYPVTLFYNKSHPSVALNVTDVFVQENEKYGMNFSYRDPVSPVSMNFEAYNQNNTGNSFTQVVDDRNSYRSLSTNTRLNNGGDIQLSHKENEQDSRSGTKSLTIKPFNIKTKTTDLNSRIFLGEKRNANLNFIASYTTQEKDRDLKELRLAPSLTWKHSDIFNSYYRYSFLDRKLSGYENSDNSGAAGLRYQWNKNLYINSEIHSSNTEATGLQLNKYGASGSLTYKRQLDIGLLQFNFGMNYDDYDRVTSGSVQVANSNYTLSGTTPVTLAHNYIDTSTIVVRRTDTNELLTKGAANDYIVVVISNKTQIQKVNPALPTNLNVLVSYQYNAGGSATYESIGQNYQTSLQFNKNIMAYLNYRDNRQNLKSGSPTLPLNSSDTVSYGFRVDYPFQTDIDWTVGGEVLAEKHNENVSSYNKSSWDIFTHVALPLSSNLHLSMRQLRVDNLYSSEDVELIGYLVRLKSNPIEHFTVIFQYSNEKNSGGSLSRHNQDMSLSGQWRIRKLLLEFGARNIVDKYGLIEQDRTIFNITLKRDF